MSGTGSLTAWAVVLACGVAVSLGETRTPPWGGWVLLLAATAVVPLLLLRMRAEFADGTPQGRLLCAAVCWYRPAAVLLLLSFVRPPSLSATLLCLPWGGVLLRIALAELLRCWRERSAFWSAPDRRSVDGGLTSLAAAAA